MVRDVEYGRAGDVSLRLDACTPPGPGPFPVAILVHGGGWSGHGVCGISRFEARSVVATVTFMLTGALAVLALKVLS